MPAVVDLASDELVIHVEGADRLWALKGQLRIPLANVVSAQPAEEEASKWLHGVRVGGTHIPGVISAGRFYAHGQLVFWDVHNAGKAIAIEVRDERYDKLVVEVEDPEREVARIREAAAAASA